MPRNKQNSNEGIKSILKDPRFADKIILKDMLPVKMSTVIMDFAKPLLGKIDLTNKSVVKKTIQTAIEVWNYSIVIDKACIEAGAADNMIYRKALAGIAKTKLTSRINMTDYLGLLDRKKTLYPDNRYFVIEHNVRWSNDDRQMHLAVVTGDASKALLEK